MSIPEELKYTKDHEWALVEGNVVTIGITHHAQEQLGDVVYIELPDEEDEITKGETFGVVESTKAVSDLYAPISGTVVEMNDPLLDAPETVNTDPYGDAWMIKVEVADTADLDGMLDAAAYKKFVEEAE